MDVEITPSNQPPEENVKDKLKDLIQNLKNVEDEKNGLETLLEIVTEHSTILENQILDQSQAMQIYIQQVEKVTDAAIAVKNGTFHPETLADVANREDELGELARVFTHMVETVKSREQELLSLNQQLEQLLNAYARFVPNEFLQYLHKKSIVDVRLGDHVSKEMAIMFSDIRSFTSLSEKMTPQENFNFINAYLGRVSPEIRNYNGFIIKYLGDGMMAVFPDGVDDAVRAGIAKFQKVQQYNQHLQEKGFAPLLVGIGIHVGHMMVGMVGEANRMEGDALSSNVTLTARLEGLTKYYGVSLLISEEVRLRLGDPNAYQLRFLDHAVVMGRTDPITIYEVLDAECELQRSLKIDTLAAFESAQQYYQQGDFAAAKTTFEQILQHNPEDKTVRFLLKRVDKFLQEGVPDAWNGVWLFTSK